MRGNKLESICIVGLAGPVKVIEHYGFAKENNIEYIVDDGLLIKVMKSFQVNQAKREKTRIKSI